MWWEMIFRICQAHVNCYFTLGLDYTVVNCYLLLFLFLLKWVFKNKVSVYICIINMNVYKNMYTISDNFVFICMSVFKNVFVFTH